jgi:hypothetical protein
LSFGRLETPVVVIDPSVETAAAAAEAGFLVLTGDATDDALLHAAGVSRARGLVVTTDRDATNLYVVLSARLLNSALFIVSRAVDEASVPKLLRAGANRALSPYAIGGRRLAHSIHSPRVVDSSRLRSSAVRTRFVSQTSSYPPALAGAPCTGCSNRVVRVPPCSRCSEWNECCLRPLRTSLLMAEDHVLVLGTETQVNAIERTVSAA